MEEKKEIGKVKYGAEPTRHFPRYRIPAYIEIDGKRYKLKDWSLGGCAIYDLPDEYLERKWAVGNLIIPFDTFEVTVKDLKLEFLRRNPDGTVGCRFSELNPDQLSLMQDVIEAYLEGSIVSLDEFVNVVKREDLREALEASRPRPPKRTGTQETIRRVFILLIFFLFSATLIFFLLEALKVRVFTVYSLSSFVDTDLVVLRTPLTGVINLNNIKKGDELKAGQPLGSVLSPYRISVVLNSPVSGTIASIYVKNQEIAKEGDPIVGIVPTGAKFFVRSNIIHKDAEKIKLGQTVTVIFPNGREVEGRVFKITSGPKKAIAQLHSSTPVPVYANPWQYDAIKIEIPQDVVTANDVGETVVVKIDVTPKYLKPLLWWLP